MKKQRLIELAAQMMAYHKRNGAPAEKIADFNSLIESANSKMKVAELNAHLKPIFIYGY